MKKAIYFFVVFVSLMHSSRAQGLKGLIKSIRKDSGSAASTNMGISGLSGSDIAGGLKEALNAGITKGTRQLSATDGFFKNAVVKILLPPEAAKVEKTLRGVGLGSEVDKAILAMNRAAEDAAKSAAPIFLDAVKNMNIDDALSILKGGDTAATHFLRGKTVSSLTAAFRPVIDSSLQKTDATKYWNTVFASYNKMPFTSKVNPDLVGYVTEKGLSGIFYEVAQQEAQIRKNPAARTTTLLKKVFAQQ